MMSGFKQFALRGNVVDMAVGVVAGGAFAAVVAALTKDLLTPLIAALVGKPDSSAIRFTVHGSVFALGDFINALVSFLLVAVVVYFFVIPINAVTAEGSKLFRQGTCRSRARNGRRVIPSRRLREGDLEEAPAKVELCGGEPGHHRRQCWSRGTRDRRTKLKSS
jgi:large conductance mechanosensitive channel